MAKEYIEREALIEEISQAQDSLKTNNDYMWEKINKKYYKGLCMAHRIILDAPAADVVEVKHGKWIEKPYLFGTTRYCSLCGENYGMPHGIYNYCPNCGAKMMEADEC